MKKSLLALFAAVLMGGVCCVSAKAEESVTIDAKSESIADGLDLRAVITLFARSADLEKFETALNNPDSAFTNLDLNGDGQVDYLRVIEHTTGSTHKVVIQAVLATDIYQDVATITVDKDENGNYSMKAKGDERIYGENYIIEPVFYYRPVIYDWFWGPSWYAWHSPYYWDYWPGWWRPYAPCVYVVYVDRCRHYSHVHGHCSYRTSAPARYVTPARSGAPSRQPMATSQRRMEAPSRQAAAPRHEATSASRPTATSARSASSRPASAPARATSATASRPTASSASRSMSSSSAQARAPRESSSRSSQSAYSGYNSPQRSSSSFSGSSFGGGSMSHGGGSSHGGGASHSASGMSSRR